MKERIILKDEDVIWMETKYSPCGNTTNTVREVNDALCRSNVGDSWVHDGIPGSVLFTDSDGWRKGKVRITLEFIPDKSDSEQSQTAQPLLPPYESPLDDLRKELDL